MTNILLFGANGHMGKVVARIAEADPDAQIIAGVDLNTEAYGGFPIYSSAFDVKEKADVIIDFSHPSLFDSIMEYAEAENIPSVICTTGLSKEQTSKLKYMSEKIPIFFSANMSLGVNLLIDLVRRASKILEDNFNIEIIEKHHNQKVDAPSGTALAIADAISDTVSYEAEYIYDRHSVRRKRGKSEIGIHSLRGGTIVGEHSVIFAGTDEVIELKHTAASKEVFAAGAVKAAKFMKDKGAGLYAMSDLISAV